MMEFIYPRYLWLLLAIPAVLLFWGVGVWHHRRMRLRFGNIENLEEISRVSWGGHGWLQGVLFAASLAGMILGLAYPQMLGRELRPVPMPTDVIFMLDISPSMFAKDMDPSRLGRAQQVIQQFILNKLPDDRYSLVSFNFNSIVLSYLTRDPQSILVYFDFLNQTEEPGIGTNMGAALVSGVRVMQADEQVNPGTVGKRRRVLILISDGDDNIGQWQEPLAEVMGRRVKVYTFGLGTATGAYFPLVMAPGGEVVKYATTMTGERLKSKAQARTLRDLAERAGGRFFRGEDNRQVQAAIDEILISGRPVAGYQANPTRQDVFFYFLSAAFLCLLGAIFL
ncbi:MAG: VWA domain-containing protein [Acidobacteria bacterium]|nr:VWA domain-containing protein [Acidobacteriota bacterium]